MANFGKDRFPPSYQNAVGMNAREGLHKNSIELANILKEFSVLDSSNTIFELGSGPGRNLYYINVEKPTIQLFCSDLFKDASFESMHDDIKQKITFFEGDSEEVVSIVRVPNLDILLISDHLMHLQYEKADKVLNAILTKWQPSFLLLRELKKEFENPSHPRLYHNYEKLLVGYDLLHETSSEQDQCYFIWLMKRR